MSNTENTNTNTDTNTYTCMDGRVLDDYYFTAMRMVEKAFLSREITLEEANEWLVKLGINQSSK